MTVHTGGLNGAEVRAYLSGHLYMAPVGTALPTDTTTALPAPWNELGYTTDAGLEINPTITTNPVKAWQTRQDVRELISEFGYEVKFELEQRNKDNLKLAFGGGTIAAGTGSDWIYTPPSSSTVFEMAFVFECFDGAIIDRWLLQRGAITTLGAIKISAAAASTFPVIVKNLAPADGSVGWSLISNDPAMNTD